MARVALGGWMAARMRWRLPQSLFLESLESLHGPEFDALVERARQNAAAQRAE